LLSLEVEHHQLSLDGPDANARSPLGIVPYHHAKMMMCRRLPRSQLESLPTWRRLFEWHHH
jgi:hypothetical protein